MFRLLLLPLAPTELSRPEPRRALVLGLIYLALSIVPLRGELDRAAEWELLLPCFVIYGVILWEDPPLAGETLTFALLELERFSVISARPVITLMSL